MNSLGGQQVLRRDESVVSADSALDGKKIIAFYFSAHWCPPCRLFTPVLAEFYSVSSSWITLCLIIYTLATSVSMLRPPTWLEFCQAGPNAGACRSWGAIWGGLCVQRQVCRRVDGLHEGQILHVCTMWVRKLFVNCMSCVESGELCCTL